MNEPTGGPKLSKRQFLFGAAAGAAGLQSAHWLAASPKAAAAKEPKHKVSFSQSGEDIIASFMFEHLGLGKPTYIDIGAYDPIDMNNTYLFYLQGSRGVLVEPNVDLTESLNRVRKGDTILTAGIGPDATTSVDYYRLSEPSWNTFDKDQVDHVLKETKGRKDEVKLLEVVKMPLLNINEVFVKYFQGGTPDFVSIDVEGLDLPILQSVNFEKHRPKVICVETLITGTKDEKAETGQFLLSKGYILRGASFVNSVFIDKKLVEKR